MESTRQHVEAALTGYPAVLDAYVFGSTARGDAGAGSDVDVAVFLDPALDPPARATLKLALMTDLMASLQRNDVDLVVLNEAGPMLYHRVLRDGVLVVSRDEMATTTRAGYALSRWCDWEPVQRRIDAIYRSRIRHGEFGR